jgi:hypothetical protein
VRSLDLVRHELELLHKQCDRGTVVHLSDTIVNGDAARFSALCGILNWYKDKLTFSVDTRMDHVDEHFARATFLAGIRYIRMGSEALHASVLESGNSGRAMHRLGRVTRLIRKYNPEAIIHLYWMTGLPASTHATVTAERAVIRDLIRRRIVDIIGNKIMVPYPATQHFDQPERFGIMMLGRPWSEFDRMSPPVYDLRTLSSEAIYTAFMSTEEVQIDAYHRAGVGAAARFGGSSTGFLGRAYLEDDNDGSLEANG